MITEDTLTSLRNNDDRLDNLFVYLDDYSFSENGDEEDEVALLQALQKNTRVTAVDMDMHLDDELGAPLQEFMTQVGRLQNLQRLRCSSSGDYAVTMAAMAKAIQSNVTTSTKLVSLDLANFLLQSKESTWDLAPVSYENFVDSLRHHPTLKSFNLGFGFVSSAFGHTGSSSFEQGDDPSAAHRSLTPLFRSLVTLPALDWVRLDGAGFASREALTVDGLAILLCGPSSITTLEVHDFELTPGHVEAMAKALATNTKLRVLSVSCHCYNIAQAETGAAATMLAQALRQNKHLQKLYLPLLILQGRKNGKTSKEAAGLMELFQALEVNCTLQKLHITGETSPATTTLTQLHQSFRRMLQNNYGLQTVQIPSHFASDEWEQEIQLHTRLNAIGRGRLAKCVGGTRSQWVNVFGQVQDDVSCLFHLLLLNPLLCSSSSAPVTGVKLPQALPVAGEAA